VAAVLAAAVVGVLLLVTGGTADVQGAGKATSRQTQASAQPKAERGLRVGAARIDITPPANPDYPPLDEYEHEKLNLRAIVIESGGRRAALIGADLGGIDEPVWADAAKRVAAELQTPVQNIIISSTHTHSGTPVPPTPNPGPRYGTDFVPDAAVRAVKEASAKLEPAKVGYSTGTADLNVNRDAIDPVTGRWTQAANLDGPADKSVGVLSFVRPDGSPIAAYVNYAMHPVNAYLANSVSADFAGAMSRYVEQAFGDDMVTVFTQGASGDINPRWLRTGTNMLASKSNVPVTGYELVREKVEQPLRDFAVPHGPVDPHVLHELFDYIQALGIVLGEEAIRVMSHTEFTAKHSELWGRQEIVTCPGRTRLDDAREGVPGQYVDGPPVDIRLGVLGIGKVALSSVDAEIYTKIGMRVKQESPLKNTMVVTLANGKAASGYIPDDESFSHQTFQVLGSKLKPGCAEDAIVNGISGLVSKQRILQARRSTPKG
jgi:neutral ceramidase